MDTTAKVALIAALCSVAACSEEKKLENVEAAQLIQAYLQTHCELQTIFTGPTIEDPELYDWVQRNIADSAAFTAGAPEPENSRAQCYSTTYRTINSGAIRVVSCTNAASSNPYTMDRGKQTVSEIEACPVYTGHLEILDVTYSGSETNEATVTYSGRGTYNAAAILQDSPFRTRKAALYRGFQSKPFETGPREGTAKLRRLDKTGWRVESVSE